MRRTVCIPVILLVLLLAGCKSTYYKAMPYSRAIGSLKSTSAALLGNVADLIQSIDASSQEADNLISSLAVSDSKN